MIRVGTVGLPVQVTILDQSTGGAEDLSAATELVLVVQPPAGAAFQVTAGLVTDGKDGKIKYTDPSSTLTSVTGSWQAQPWWKDAAGTWPADPFSWYVGPSLAPSIA